MLGGVGGALVALPALEILSGALGTLVTIFGYVLLFVALIGGGVGGGKWSGRPRAPTAPEGAPEQERSPSRRLSGSERLMLLFAFLQVVGTFAGLLLQG
jgi:hypothetical protein